MILVAALAKRAICTSHDRSDHQNQPLGRVVAVFSSGGPGGTPKSERTKNPADQRVRGVACFRVTTGSKPIPRVFLSRGVSILPRSTPWVEPRLSHLFLFLDDDSRGNHQHQAPRVSADRHVAEQPGDVGDL